MSASFSHEVERLAAERGLALIAEPLYSAPRDIAAPPAEMDQHHLASIVSADGDSAGVRLVFITPLGDRSAPTLRDVLWWLAGDAWAVQRARGSLDTWAAMHGYPCRDPATAQLFAHHVTQASSLEQLFGAGGYRALLAAYAAEVTPRARPVNDRVRR
ncbi:MAG: hypothetical protein ACJ79K_12410 [Gemmatimonadaceae bacterium]